MLTRVLSDKEMAELSGVKITGKLTFILIGQDLYRRTDGGWEPYDDYTFPDAEE